MTDKQEREAIELTGFLRDAVKYPDLATLVRKPLLAHATKLLKSVDGTTKNELQIARENVRAL
jgi:hypothetical protein